MSIEVDILAPVRGTTVRYGDLVLIGTSLLDLAVTCDLMRHATPAGTLDYADPGDSFGAQVVCDFTAWAGAAADHQHRRDRLLAYLTQTGWAAQRLASLTERGAA